MRRAPAWAFLLAQLRVSLAVAAGYERRPVARLARVVAGRPRVEEGVVGGVPADLYLPARRPPPWHAAVVIPGVTRRGRRHPAFVGLGRGLAAAGFLAVVAEPEGLAAGELTPASVEHARAAVHAVASRTDVRGGRVALAGVSGGATLALLVAGDRELAPRVSAVAALAPCCDIREALRLVTTGTYLRGRSPLAFTTGPFFRLVLARSAVAWLDEGPERDLLRGHVLGLDDYGHEPLATLSAWPADGLQPGTRRLLALLANEDPARFEGLYGDLAESHRAAVETLSAIRVAGRIEAPVELVVAREDKYVPLADAEAFADACPYVRVTVIDSLEHAVPRVSPAAARDLARLDVALVRLLQAASSPSYSGP